MNEKEFSMKTEECVEERPVPWRMDAAESMSDWEIEVKCEDTLETKLYNVHKVYLGAGMFRSKYFSTLFKSSSNLKELKECKSRITLKYSATKAFPDFLDHIYTGKCNINVTNAIALRFLATYFIVPTLTNLLRIFLEEDIERNYLNYVSDAAIYNDIILPCVIRKSAKEFEKVDIEKILSLDSVAFELVVASQYLKCDSLKLSSRVAEYCRRHANITGDFFSIVTDPSIMPNIEPYEALYFINMCIKCRCSKESTESLIQRCIAACKDWEAVFQQTVLKPKPNEADELYYSTIPDSIKVKLLESAFVSANDDYSRLKYIINGFHDITKGLLKKKLFQSFC